MHTTRGKWKTANVEESEVSSGVRISHSTSATGMSVLKRQMFMENLSAGRTPVKSINHWGLGDDQKTWRHISQLQTDFKVYVEGRPDGNSLSCKCWCHSPSSLRPHLEEPGETLGHWRRCEGYAEKFSGTGGYSKKYSL